MFRLIYSSEVSDTVSMKTIEDILKVAHSRNNELGVTGVLLCDGFKFLQVLEGGPEEIQSLLQSIKQDPRHHDLEILMQGESNTRFFSDWSMGFVDTGTVLADLVQSLDGQSFSDAKLNLIIDDLRDNPVSVNAFLEKCLDALQVKTKPNNVFRYLASILKP